MGLHGYLANLRCDSTARTFMNILKQSSGHHWQVGRARPAANHDQCCLGANGIRRAEALDCHEDCAHFCTLGESFLTQFMAVLFDHSSNLCIQPNPTCYKISIAGQHYRIHVRSTRPGLGRSVLCKQGLAESSIVAASQPHLIWILARSTRHFDSQNSGCSTKPWPIQSISTNPPRSEPSYASLAMVKPQEISNPRRILAVALEGQTEVLSRVVKGMRELCGICRVYFSLIHDSDLASPRWVGSSLSMKPSKYLTDFRPWSRAQTMGV